MATFLTYKADMDEDTFYDDAAAEIKLLATSVLFVVSISGVSLRKPGSSRLVLIQVPGIGSARSGGRSWEMVFS